MISDKDIRKILGRSLKELRSQKGITQERLAEFLGVQPATIAKIETGLSFISSAFFSKLCNFFANKDSGRMKNLRFFVMKMTLQNLP